MIILSRLVFLLLVLLAACSRPSQIEVIDREVISVAQQTDKIGGQLIRIAMAGDTLYGIAFEQGLDIKQLAAWNNLKDTSKLAIGQRIRLTRPYGFKEPEERTEIVKIEPNTPPEKSDSKVTTKPQEETKTVKPLPLPAWQWPLKGAVITQFSQNKRLQGIDIKGQAGQPVLASQAGEVMYVGDGLKGYGNLVIIKHNDIYLSAYANNLETFVREGQNVTAKQQIASVGYNKRQQPALHFQIRKNGKPVNPLSVLP